MNFDSIESSSIHGSAETRYDFYIDDVQITVSVAVPETDRDAIVWHDDDIDPVLMEKCKLMALILDGW